MRHRTRLRVGLLRPFPIVPCSILARIVLPPANAAVVVRAQRDDGTPVPHVHVFFKYNGLIVPFDVRNYFTYRRVRMLTGSDGAVLLTHMLAGEYDFFG